MARKIIRFYLLLIFLFVLQVKGLKAGEIPKFCQVVLSEPDGNNDYYRKAPKIMVKHMDENLVSRYQLDFPGGKKIVGKLQGAVKSEGISSKVFVEGTHELNTWLEDAKGQVISGTEQTREIKIDRNAPTLMISSQTEGEGNARMQNSKAVVVEIKGEDTISGVAGVYYSLGDGIEQYIEGNHVFVSIPQNFQGVVSAYTIDYAGNVSRTYQYSLEKLESKGQTMDEREIGEMFKENVEESNPDIGKNRFAPQLTIEGIENGTIVGKCVRYTCRVRGDSQIQSVEGQVVRENEKGEKETIELTDWREEEGQYVFCGELNRDGMYSILIKIMDLEGKEYRESTYVIVDKTNPLIQSLEELNGAQLKSFQWDYSIDEIVNEFTTYSYEVRLDGVLCDTDKVYTKQGKHILEILVADAAGNESRATAVFYIVNEKAESTGVSKHEKNPSVLRWIWPCILLFIIGLVGVVWVFKEKSLQKGRKPGNHFRSSWHVL